MDTPRLARIGDAAIELIAREGLRGLTHRGVDREAGLPSGSTSYYARTRLALLELTIERMVELDDGYLARPVEGPHEAAEAIAAFLHHAVTDGRTRTLARYELALEATRRPELRAAYDRGGRRLREHAAAVLTKLGVAEPDAHVRTLVGWCEGIVFDALAGAGGEPSMQELAAGARSLLWTVLREP
ncbi:TetR/AcrR family transcriptional regulator [Prauserella flavalba]|uniref:TetR family transcriptional regulator n=1 Tax=Prauserella flavalba TaxID=1477506 RepID=A0A318LCZ1_9PSEU|nr:TetR/AcrR family transcriptional regulator [Prauserella flavalba]PXY18306.1 TetR family transcriptional regulator [Prauserella flavalba]